MLALALLAPLQILGCAPADADRARQRLDLELQGAAVSAVELRCGAKTRLEVQVGDRRDAREFPRDVLAQPDGPRLVAVAAADLAEDLRTNPERPLLYRLPPKPAPRPTPTEMRLYLSGMFRLAMAEQESTALQPGAGLAFQLRRRAWLLEVDAAAFFPTSTPLPDGTTTATRFDAGLAGGAALDIQTIDCSAVLGWRAGHAQFEGEADDGVTRSVGGVFGGPFMGLRIEVPARHFRLSVVNNFGWSVWTVRGRIRDTVAEAEAGFWFVGAIRLGFDL